MENAKYLGFYALLLVILVLGFLQKTWLLIVPAALVLALAYMAVKGSSWKQIMGKGEVNVSVVFIGILLSQLLTSAIFFGIGRLVALLFN